MALAALPLPRIGGRPLTAYLHPVLATVGDRLTRRGVFRGAVFAPASLAHRMDLPGDLVNYRSVAVPTPDGRSTVGLMVNDREKVACAALLTFGSAMLLEGSTEQGMRLDDWEAVMEGFCADGAGVSRWQLLARTAPDVVNVASRHAREHAVVRTGPAWQATQELIAQAAPAAQRHEVYLVVAFDLRALGDEITALSEGSSRDEAVGVVVLERLLDLERGITEARIASRGWLRPGQYAALIHTQFDPESLPLHDVLAGADHDLDPRLAGPAATERAWKSFRHDSAVSRTVWVHELPKRPVPDELALRAGARSQSGLRRTLSLVAEPLGEVKAQSSAERQALRAESSAAERRKLGRPTTAQAAEGGAGRGRPGRGAGRRRRGVPLPPVPDGDRAGRENPDPAGAFRAAPADPGPLPVHRALRRAGPGVLRRGPAAGPRPVPDARGGRGMTTTQRTIPPPSRAAAVGALPGVSVPGEVARRLAERDAAAAAAAAQAQAEREQRRMERLTRGAGLDRRGGKGVGAGRLWGRMRLQAHTAPSRMLKGIYPWIMDPGLGVPGAYVGQDLFSQASFLFDPFELYAAGVISSPNMALVGEIGAGKSALMKSLILRLLVFGISFSWVQVKPEYEDLCKTLGVQPLRIGPGQLVRLNPLAEVRRHPEQNDVEHRAGNRSRRIALLEGLLQVALRRGMRPVERSVIGWALDAATGADDNTNGGRLAPVSLPSLLGQLVNPDPVGAPRHRPRPGRGGPGRPGAGRAPGVGGAGHRVAVGDVRLHRRPQHRVRLPGGGHRCRPEPGAAQRDADRAVDGVRAVGDGSRADAPRRPPPARRVRRGVDGDAVPAAAAPLPGTVETVPAVRDRELDRVPPVHRPGRHRRRRQRNPQPGNRSAGGHRHQDRLPAG